MLPAFDDNPDATARLATETVFGLAHAVRKKKFARRRSKGLASSPAATGNTGVDSMPSPQAPTLSRSQRRGLEAEARAVAWLQAKGLQLLATNLRCPCGELDAVFRADARTLVLVEIRLRRSASHGGAAASITAAKRQRLRRTAAWYLPSFTASAFAGIPPLCRFDAVCIEGDTLTWLQSIL